jgi:hypothetical protein
MVAISHPGFEEEGKVSCDGNQTPWGHFEEYSQTCQQDTDMVKTVDLTKVIDAFSFSPS